MIIRSLARHLLSSHRQAGHQCMRRCTRMMAASTFQNTPQKVFEPPHTIAYVVKLHKQSREIAALREQGSKVVLRETRGCRSTWHCAR